jgi:hypothetical protein
MAETDPNDLTGAIQDSATGPARVVIDGQVAEEHLLARRFATGQAVCHAVLPGADWRLLVSTDGIAWAVRPDGLTCRIDLAARARRAGPPERR